jgi:peptidyl-tRNA hydrolase, PTH1 family
MQGPPADPGGFRNSETSREAFTVTRILVGLGNPGPEYDRTRHNVGFMVLDAVALHEGLLFQTASSLESSLPDDPSFTDRGYGGVKRFRFARSFDPDALLVKPESFMNRSGDVVAPFATWAEVPTSSILVVFDDLDLEFGRLRLRPHGGAGGHNGMRSIIDSLGTDQFPRLRVGIGRPRTDAARHVLEPFAGKELEEIEISIAEAKEAALDWLVTGDIERCMTRFHSRWSQGA